MIELIIINRLTPVYDPVLWRRCPLTKTAVDKIQPSSILFMLETLATSFYEVQYLLTSGT